jgi:hypothetical protein
MCEVPVPFFNRPLDNDAKKGCCEVPVPILLGFIRVAVLTSVF